MEEFDLLLADRLGVIKQFITKQGPDKFYLSFSGGKDSTVLHYLLDEALPGNDIPRVYVDTGIEYKDVREFVFNMAKSDTRIKIIAPSKPIKATLEKYGYPFKSKEHAKKVQQYQARGNLTDYLKEYLTPNEGGKHSKFKCPAVLRYQFTEENKLKISHLCCQKLKKDPVKKYSRDTGRTAAITGMRKEEGGLRASLTGCVFTDKKGNIVKFHPLLIVSEQWEEEYIKRRNIKLCRLYYPPFNFKRTGCKGCPFALELQEQLTTMQIYLPEERKQCEIIWAPVYAEYRKIGYRLEKKEQLKLF